MCMPANSCMEPAINPNISKCPTCGALIDVSKEEPYAKVQCPACSTSMRVRQMFANYEIIGVLGEGGQGMVYRAVDKKLNRAVAIKLMKREYSEDPIFVRRFQSEAKVTASLSHPNVVKVFSFGEDMGLLYLAMEVVDHGSLDALMTEVKKVPEERALDVGIQIAKGLQAGLEKGLIHRDIKPGNILFSDANTAKIVDFGLAILVEKQHEEEGEVWATPFYVSPEKLDGQQEDFRSDMYSLAATLFHAIAGRPPFIAETNSISELKKIKSKPVRLQSYAPHAAAATAYVIDKALAVKREDRWASYEEFIQNLEYARGEYRKRPHPVAAPRTVALAHEPRGGGGITFVILAAMIAAGVYFAFTYFGKQSVAPPVVVTPSKPQADDAEARYNHARLQLIKGDFRPAAVEFRNLYADGRLPEPRNSWSAVHEGLCELLAGRPAQARSDFGDLSKRISPAAIGLDAKLVSFFTRLCELASASDHVSAEEAEKFDQKSHEVIALLVLGLKDWEGGDLKNGIELLKQYQACSLAGDAAWAGEYRALATPYIEEYSLFSKTAETLRKYETEPELVIVALKHLPEVKDRIKSSALLGQINQIERDVATKLTDMITAKNKDAARKKAANDAADAQAITDAKIKVKNLCDRYLFKEAFNLIHGLDLKGDTRRKERDMIAHRVEWLMLFKDKLMFDINSLAYKSPILRRNGQQIIGGVVHANEANVEIQFTYGTVPVPWTELAPQSVLTMAIFYINPSKPPKSIADRKWYAGVFCMFSQLYPEARTLMDEVAGMDEQYRLLKDIYFPPPAADTKNPPRQSNGAKSETGFSNGTENADKPLNPSRRGFNDLIRGQQ